MSSKIRSNTLYHASDGAQFQTREAAERYEELITARRDYDAARMHLARVLAERCKTADGCEFSFAIWGDYFWVSNDAGEPQIVQLWLYGDNWGVGELSGDTSEIVLYAKRDRFGQDLDHSTAYPISELYRDRDQAVAVHKARSIAYHRAALAALE